MDYAVGDLHGCCQELEQLLESVSFDPASDRLWCVGDFVGRGPDVPGLLHLLKSLGDRCLPVLGNHDLRLLEMAAKADSCATGTRQPLSEELLHWLSSAPVVQSGQIDGVDGVSRTWVMVHAGVHPHWTLELLNELGQSIGAAMQSQRAELLAIALAPPLCWRQEMKGLERAGTALSYLTRVRHLHADGSMDVSRAGQGLVPADASVKGWFEYPLKILSERADVQLLFGHWAALGGQIGTAKRVYALDTGAVWGGRLTALRLQDQRFFSVSGLARPLAKS